MLITQPHLPVVDRFGMRTEFVAFGGPLDTEHSRRVNAKLKAQGRPFVGFMSHGTFPFLEEQPSTDYLGMCAGWCHCLRDSSGFEGLPLLELSHSDLLDTDWVTPQRFGTDAREWDYIYVCLPGKGPERAKNWTLARACIATLSAAGFHGLLVGRIVIRDLPRESRVSLRGRLRWAQLLHLIARSRVLLVTSGVDASPRILAEALALNRPVLVNEQILGGWKYVTPVTGRFFTDADDVVTALSTLIAASTSPREWFCDSYGRVRAGGRLRDFLIEIGGEVESPYVYIGDVPYFDQTLDA